MTDGRSRDRRSLRYRQEVRPDDRDNVRRIVASSGFFFPEEIEVAVELVEENLARGAASGYFFLFVEKNGETVGYACFGPIACTKGSFDLYWIAVRDDQRGAGIGKKLLAKTERIIADMGGGRIYVETSSRPQYDPTRSFYERCGYGAEATLKDFYFPGDHKVIYVKEIAPR